MNNSLSHRSFDPYKPGFMPPALRPVAYNPSGAVLPSDVLGAAVERLNDLVIVTEATPVDEPGPHRVGGRRGCCQHEDPLWRRALPDEPRETLLEHARLAASRRPAHDQRAIPMRDRFELCG